MQTVQITMPMGNHHHVNPPLSEKGSIVSLSGNYKESCARKTNSRGHSEMCAEMCRVDKPARVSEVPPPHKQITDRKGAFG